MKRKNERKRSRESSFSFYEESTLRKEDVSEMFRAICQCAKKGQCVDNRSVHAQNPFLTFENLSIILERIVDLDFF